MRLILYYDTASEKFSKDVLGKLEDLFKHTILSNLKISKGGKISKKLEDIKTGDDYFTNWDGMKVMKARFGEKAEFLRDECLSGRAINSATLVMNYKIPEKGDDFFQVFLSSKKIYDLTFTGNEHSKLRFQISGEPFFLGTAGFKPLRFFISTFYLPNSRWIVYKIIHEFGHSFGLKDAKCKNENCVMHPEERFGKLKEITGEIDRKLEVMKNSQLYFCEECWNKIKA